MSTDAIIGVGLVISALIATTYLVFRSKRIIDRISEKKYESLRDILRDTANDR